MVGDWKSLLFNLGGTGPDPTLGGSAEAVVLLVDAAVLEEVVCVAGSTDTERELEPGDVQEGSPVAGALEDETATPTVGVDEVEACDCAWLACLACSLLAALVCQPHEQGLGLSAETLKNDPCRHLLIEAIAAKTSLLDGFWPLPVNTRCPSARSINCSAYSPTPWKWCGRDISADGKTPPLHALVPST